MTHAQEEVGIDLLHLKIHLVDHRVDHLECLDHLDIGVRQEVDLEFHHHLPVGVVPLVVEVVGDLMTGLFFKFLFTLV